ncbi:MAG: hypothetical protein GY913_11660 [Proteobacteria bacterium]|nr:hypothetical protein [Pseudomonadota bacterium]MCP4917570.1 hypothetical protein [Pseudomonadota bacterium]
MLLLSLACSASHGVRPVGQGNHAVEVSVGGPVARLGGKPIPIPLSTVGWRYGVHDRSDVHLRLQPTAAALGIWAGDVGASWMLLDQEGRRPAVVTEGSLLVSGNAAGFRTWGELETLASWELGEKRHLVYGGADLLLQPARANTDYLPTRRVLAGPVLGARWMAGERLGIATAVTWWEPWTDSEALTAYYYSPGQQGAVSLELGLHVVLPQRGGK